MARTLRPAPTNCTPVARQSALSAGACSCARTCAHLNLLPPSHTHRLAPCACTFFPPLPTPRPLSLSPQPPPSLCLLFPSTATLARSLVGLHGVALNCQRCARVASHRLSACASLSRKSQPTERTTQPTQTSVNHAAPPSSCACPRPPGRLRVPGTARAAGPPSPGR